jgi:hypothetical protein
MSFLYPLFLLGALATAIPVVLHFLRRDVAPEVPFSAVRLLRRSPVARARRRRLRDLLLLAARVAALLLLSAAFARPYIKGAAATSAALRIVAVDRSFSMGAPGRFAGALELARRAVDGPGPGERVAVIAFDDHADVVAPPGTAADARAALDRLQPGFGGTRYGPLLAKAAETADGRPARLVLISDLQRTGWEDEPRGVLPSAVQLEIKNAGAAPGNVAVGGVRIDKDRIVASVRNGGHESRSGQIRVERDGRSVASAAYRAPGDSIVDVPVAYRVPDSGSIAVSVDDPGGFPADDTRYAVLDPAVHQRALVVTSGAGDFYLSRALSAASEDAAEDAVDGQVAAAADLAGNSLARYSAIVLLSTRGLERRGRESIAAFVRGGGGMLIAASPDVEPVVLSTIFEWRPALSAVEQSSGVAALSATDLRHPIFRPFGALAANLGQIRFERAWRVRADGWDVAARFTDGTPALLERAEGKGRVVLFASDLGRRWNDFPLHPAFVPFAVETVRYVSGVRDRGRDYSVARVPDGAQPRPGIYRAQPDGRTVAVNVDPRESAAAAMTPDEFESRMDRVSAGANAAAELQARQTEARQSYWQYGLLLMLAALVAESFVGRA